MSNSSLASIRLSRSCDLHNTQNVILEGLTSQISIIHGVICAQCRIHMLPTDTLRLGDILVRVHLDYHLAIHIDADEVNTTRIVTDTFNTIAEIQSRAEHEAEACIHHHDIEL